VSHLPALAAALLRAGRGRLFPVLLLAVAATLLHHIEKTPLQNLQASQFDRYQRLLPRERENEPVIVVGIDSQSLVDHGQWPWPRDVVGQLLARIQAGAPLAVGLDFVFAERDQHAPELIARRLPATTAALLQGLPDPDAALADVLARAPTALAVVGLARELPGARKPLHPLPAVQLDPVAASGLPHFASALASRPELQAAAAGEGFINATPDKLQSHGERGILRRVPTLAFIHDQPYLSLPLEMVRQALGGGQVVVENSATGMRAIRIGDYRLPTQTNGELLLHFGKASANYYLSAADVLSGVHPPEIFASRFVIVGLNSIGLQDRVISPLGDSLPGVDIHAQVIESLLEQTALRRPHWMPLVEMSALLLGGLLLITAVPALRPRYAVFSFAGISLALIGTGYLAFLAGRWLFDGPSLGFLLAPVFMALLGSTLIAADTRRREAERQLQASREDAARVAGELDAARHIQMGLLPDPEKLFAGEPRFAIGAVLEPARAVGGDYYDCFMLDPQHLCIAVGDVSGKGVPASLFMAISKTLSGTLTRRHDDLAAAIQDIERELSRDNPAQLFVTAFIGILDVESGALVYVCAGHDAPMLKRGDRILRIETADISGPPLCALGDYPYATGHTKLQPGDLLCLFTDGVSEAGEGKDLFGLQRLSDYLAGLPETSPSRQCRLIRDEVRRFEAGAAPADDLTLLLLRWHGPLSGY
jgi:serine phosphatase RsbU (regulator of sigma subunit)